MRHIIGLLASSALLLSACGGGGSGGSPAPGPSPTASAPAPSPSPSPTCSLASRQAFARDVLDEWYLFPELLATSANPASFTSVQGYIDALTAGAGQGPLLHLHHLDRRGKRVQHHRVERRHRHPPGDRHPCAQGADRREHRRRAGTGRRD
ncbi:hypothetical protein [Blastomonas sp.]|uniref:hypothetical protein n=1 Tax=Blastomonas sp. TaxID=1909299 RepID=UPI00345DDD63